MATAIIPVDVHAPLRECAMFGALRCRVLDALLLDLPAEVPAALVDELSAWATQFTVSAGGLRGVEVTSVPAVWLDLLGWAGVPLAKGGELRWGRDLEEGAVERPSVSGDRLLLPPAARLAELSGVGLKPLRVWVAQRLGSRLQAAPGLRMYLWAAQALVVSRHDQPVGGFFFGPVLGSRTGLAIDPGGWQRMDW